MKILTAVNVLLHVVVHVRFYLARKRDPFDEKKNAGIVSVLLLIVIMGPVILFR